MIIMDATENQLVRLKSHRKTGSGISVSSNDAPNRSSDIRVSLTNVYGIEEHMGKEDSIVNKDPKEKFRQNLETKLSETQMKQGRYSMGDCLEKSPSTTLTSLKRCQTINTAPSLHSLSSTASFTSVDELDSAYEAYKEDEDFKIPPYQEMKQALRRNPEMNSKFMLR